MPFWDTIIYKGRADNRALAFTFDDGPHWKYTPLLLELLQEYHAQGTFFVTGYNLSRNRALAEEMVKQGHCLGNHTFSHPNPLFCSAHRLRDEIVRTKELIEDYTGVHSPFLRPPFGIVSPQLLIGCRQLDYSIVLWNVNSYDFQHISSSRIAHRLRPKLQPGAIVLMHDCAYNNPNKDYSNTITALKTMLEEVRNRNLQATTIANLLKT